MKKAKKEELLKRLENIEKNQDRNNNESNLSSVRSESSEKTSISDDDETQFSSEYLINSTDKFLGVIQIFLIRI